MMLKIKRVFQYIFDSDYRFTKDCRGGKYDHLSDEEYLKRMFSARMKRKLDLENPKTFTEKLQWLKLYNRKPEYTVMVDKYAVKQYVADTIGEAYIIPTLGVWDKFEDIDFDALPEQFVLKCTHDSGGLVICRDKSTLDLKKAKKKIEEALRRDFYLSTREWPYKDVPRKIIAEKYMTDKSGGLIDYKFFCFNGIADCVMVCLDRHLGDTKFYFFDKSWQLKRLNVRGKNAPKDFTVNKPECMDKMFELAEKLSKGLPFVRVDLYECNNKIYFGELTFFPDSGFDANILAETDLYFGNMINLNEVKQ